VLQWLSSTNGIDIPPTSPDEGGPRLPPPPPPGTVRLYSWELSYFSGKIRGYLRNKVRESGGTLQFEEVNATPAVVADVLHKATQSNTV
jgi:hypothetical protein